MEDHKVYYNYYQNWQGIKQSDRTACWAPC